MASLARIPDVADAAGLLVLAAGQSPEVFAATVTRFELDRDGGSVGERQRAARSVRFFAAEEGCVGVRAVLTPLDGAELKASLMQIADVAWRREHPERAETLGGHGGSPLHVRLADALVALVRGGPGAGAGAGVGVGAKPSIVVTVDAGTLEADIAGSGPGSGPVSLVDVAGLAARSDLYGAVRGAGGVLMSFGRSRRLATSLQRLAVVVRDGGRCAFDGCDAAHDRCDVHHVVEFEHGGKTDVTNLALLCGAHHTYLHGNRLRLVWRAGRWAVVSKNETKDTREIEWADTG